MSANETLIEVRDILARLHDSRVPQRLSQNALTLIEMAALRDTVRRLTEVIGDVGLMQDNLEKALQKVLDLSNPKKIVFTKEWCMKAAQDELGSDPTTGNPGNVDLPNSAVCNLRETLKAIRESPPVPGEATIGAGGHFSAPLPESAAKAVVKARMEVQAREEDRRKGVIDVETAARAVTLAKRVLQHIVDTGSLFHDDDDCQEDETCECANIKDYNDAWRALEDLEKQLP